MTDKFITVVFRLKTQEDVVQMQNDPRLVAFSLGDRLKDRYFCQRCGKRVDYDSMSSVHTCSLPADKRPDWSAS